jgi:transcriptional regulator with XRE-family HTH domain
MKLNKENLNKLVGQNIRLLRQSKGYTIEKLALEANIESKQLRRIELGEVNTSIYQIYNLANSMGIHIIEFLNNIPE